jgi:hypothetical protein
MLAQAASPLLLTEPENAHLCITFPYLALFDAYQCLKMPPHCGDISGPGARTSHANDTASIPNAGELSVANDDAAGPRYSQAAISDLVELRRHV